MGKKVAVVTGANRGIGFAIVRRLCQHFPGDVILTARSTDKGKQACSSLKAEGLDPLWHELDVTQPASTRMFKEFIMEKYGGVDVLVCNAGAMFPKNSPLSMQRQAELMIQTNFKGTTGMCKLFVPVLRPHARIVILSSDLGLLSSLGGDLRKKFDLDRMSMYDLEGLADQYVAAVKADVWEKYGWPDRVMAAVGVFQNALAYILARDMKQDRRRNILVNAACPGVVATEAMKTYLDDNNCLGNVPATDVDDAAGSIAWVALLPSGDAAPNGEVVRNKTDLKFKE